MPDFQAREIVRTALGLLRTHPHAPALDTLDLAMQGHHGGDPDFDAPDQPFGNGIDFPSPFAELLRRSFADEISPGTTLLMLNEEDAVVVDWQTRVIDLFAERYALWGAEEAPRR